MTIQQTIHDWFLNLLIKSGVHENLALQLNMLLLSVIALFFIWFLSMLSRSISLYFFGKFASKTKTNFDDYLLKNKSVSLTSRLVPFMFFYSVIPIIFTKFPTYIPALRLAADIYFVLLIVWILRSVMFSIRDYLKTKDTYKDKPIDSFIQVLVIVIYTVAALTMFSIVTGKSVGVFLTAMGAASAVILLIFRDTILGFVASIQVSANDMVRIGDWITMEKYNADGDVIEISLATVKVRNFDNTITTIPTYFLISDSFKNWRGMVEAGGRRIKRSVKIKVSSIRYLNDEDIERLQKIDLIKDYLSTKGQELDVYNSSISVDTSLLINGRRFTNIGVYRKYIDLYIKANENLHRGMTMMARQLEPSVNGIPIELYVFTADVKWENYEHIMADLFDHLLAAVPFFDLEIYEMPTSGDVRNVAHNIGFSENHK